MSTNHLIQWLRNGAAFNITTEERNKIADRISDFEQKLIESTATINRMANENAELLEALKPFGTVTSLEDRVFGLTNDDFRRANAAIAKHGGSHD